MFSGLAQGLQIADGLQHPAISSLSLRERKLYRGVLRFSARVSACRWPAASRNQFPQPEGEGALPRCSQVQRKGFRLPMACSIPQSVPSPGGRGSFTEVYSGLAQGFQLADGLQHPAISSLCLRERALYRGVLRFSARVSACRWPAASRNQFPQPEGEGALPRCSQVQRKGFRLPMACSIPQSVPSPGGRGSFTEVYSGLAQGFQLADGLQHPAISSLCLRERALYRGVLRFSARVSACRWPAAFRNQFPQPEGEGALPRCSQV